MEAPQFDLERLEARAGNVARRLAVLANAKRLLVLCHLMKGEASVGEIQTALNITQSALSQHLARLREAGMVTTRREAQTIHYRIEDEQTLAMMGALYDTFCNDD